MKVKNIGVLSGKEVVMLYLNDDVVSISRPGKQLKRFTKIELKPGEEKIVKFELTVDDLSFIDGKLQRVVESGKFTVFIGGSQASFWLDNESCLGAKLDENMLIPK